MAEKIWAICLQKNQSVVFGVSYNLLSKLSNLGVNGSAVIFILAQNINWPTKDKSGYMFTLVILHKNHFSSNLCMVQIWWVGCSHMLMGGKGLSLWVEDPRDETGSPRFWLSLPMAQLQHCFEWMKLFSRPSLDGATAWALSTEVLSPAHQLTNPGHCLEGAVLLVVGR